jgi:hypothetical protein
MPIGRNIFYIQTTVIIQVKGAKKFFYYRTEIRALDMHLLCHWFCEIFVLCIAHVAYANSTSKPKKVQ